MMCYPEVQRKAQAEIDRVVGTDRLPSIKDRERLPYIRALCWEVLRWQPNAPLGKHHELFQTEDRLYNAEGLLGLPHCLTQDDVHAGYFLPKGTVILPNIWRASIITFLTIADSICVGECFEILHDTIHLSVLIRIDTFRETALFPKQTQDKWSLALVDGQFLWSLVSPCCHCLPAKSYSVCPGQHPLHEHRRFPE